MTCDECHRSLTSRESIPICYPIYSANWRRLSRSGEPGRPPVPNEVKELIRTMSSMNPTWGSPRIVGELAKLGMSVTKSTVEKYRVRVRKPSSPTWRAFLKNHAKDIVSIDFLAGPTVRFKILYVFLFLSVERRRIIHFGLAEHPSAAWAARHFQQRPRVPVHQRRLHGAAAPARGAHQHGRARLRQHLHRTPLADREV